MPVSRFSRRVRRVINFHGVLLIAIVIASITANAQPRSREIPAPSAPTALDRDAGIETLKRFRSGQYAHDYSFLFSLTHFPTNGDPIEFAGQLWGTWNGGGPLSRVRLFSGADNNIILKELVVHSGRDAAAWEVSCDSNAVLLSGNRVHEPILPDLNFTAFDLQMPFMYWDDYVYEGPDRIRGRPAHHFLMYPPKDVTVPIGAVRVTLDARWKAMLRAQVLNPEGKPIKTFQVLSIRKSGDEWVVRTIDLVDEQTSEKTRFSVDAAHMNLELDSNFFLPDTEIPKEVGPERSTFDWF